MAENERQRRAKAYAALSAEGRKVDWKNSYRKAARCAVTAARKAASDWATKYAKTIMAENGSAE